MRGATLVSVKASGLVLLSLMILAAAHNIGRRDSVAENEISVEDFDIPPGMEVDEDGSLSESPMVDAEASNEAPANDQTALADPEGAALDTAPQAAPAQAAAATLQPKLLYLPTISAAGRLEAQGYKIVLDDIIPVESAELCGTGGAQWTCGAMARTQFRNRLRGRALSCIVPPETPENETISASCTINGDDLASWLVQHGWARSTPDGPYLEAQEAAKKSMLGIWTDNAPD